MASLTAQDRFFIREMIDEQLDELIWRMKPIVESTGVYTRDAKMGTSQFSNLSSVARETGSLEVIMMWIQYQIGRSDVRRQRNMPDVPLQWRMGEGRGQDGFGDQLIGLIRELYQDSGRLAEQFFSEDVYRAAQRELSIGLVRQLTGQLERYYKYMSEMHR